MKVIPKFNNVLVKVLPEEEQSMGSIIVPDTGKDKSRKAEVIAVGPGFYNVNGIFIKTETKVGEIVVLPKFGASNFQYDGIDYELIKENDILAEIEK